MKALQIATVETVQSEAETAFANALRTVEDARFAHSFNRTEAKETAKALSEAERVAAWLAFDIVAAVVNDEGVEAGRNTGHEYGERIALARGIEGDAIRVYQQRGRDLATYAKRIAKEDRAKRSPLGLARKMRDQEAKAVEAATAQAPHLAEATALAADALGVSPDMVTALRATGSADAIEAFAAAFAEVKGRASLLRDAEALAARLAACDDADMVQTIKALFA